MSKVGKVFAVAVLVVLVGAVAPASEAQPPVRIGASVSQIGAYAALGQNQLRGHRLCVKHANEKGGVLGRRIELLVEDDQSKAADAVAIKMVTFQWQDGKKVIVWPDELAPGKPRFPTPPWSQRQ